ncbi:uncharacterized protein LOC105664084 [Megachile rotundata]|uniref:uncharacterized protein LOC105664084 n=1 Tax=Megachile rotundata TaxID=143995 RepID=UPI003FD54287
MEVARISVLDYIREMKKPTVCRLILCAKITNNEKIIKWINLVMKENSTEHVTGLLLINSDFLIHLIEASEDEVFQLCNKLFLINSSVVKNIKCIYIQNNAKRLFEAWYFRKLNDKIFKGDETCEDTFETASSTYKKIILNLHKLYWELRNVTNREILIEQLDLISTKGHSCIPSMKDIEFVLQSSWGYDLTKLINDYFNLNYSCNFDDYSQVSEMVQEIKYD